MVMSSPVNGSAAELNAPEQASVSHGPNGTNGHGENLDPVSHFYLNHLKLPWQETLDIPCPFCAEHGHDPGRLLIYLNRDSFLHGYFRCLNRCVPGGYPLWFARLSGIDQRLVPGYDPDNEFTADLVDFPVENLNDELRRLADGLDEKAVANFRQHGVGPRVLREMQVGYNGRYLVYPYFQTDGNCYSARCVHPERPEDAFWQGDERFRREPFSLFSVQELHRCENGALFVCEGEANLLTLRQIGFPGVAVPHYNGFEQLAASRFEKIHTVFIVIANRPESEQAAKNFAARLGFKARILRWPAGTPRNWDLWQMAAKQGRDFVAGFSEMVRHSRAFSPFTAPAREFRTFLQRLDEEQGAQYQAVTSGFPMLDRAIGGVHGLNIIGGAPKLGKSTFLVQIGSELAGRKIPVLYYDFENGRQKLYQRTLSRLCRLPVSSLSGASLSGGAHSKQGTAGINQLNDEMRARLERGRRRLEKMLFHWRVINDRTLTPELMRRHIDFIRHETRSDYTVVIVDSLHKLPFNSFAERRTGIDGWLRQLEAIRDEMQVSFLVISELSREATNSYRDEPHLGVFKGSGDIEYTADNALVLFPSTYTHSDSASRAVRGTGPDTAENRRNSLWLVASREHAPGRIADYRLDYPYWGFQEVKTDEPDVEG